MPVEVQQILQEAEKLGKLVAQHPAVARYREAQKSLSDDPDANRLMGEFNRQLEILARQESSGMPITDAQRHQIEGLQRQIASHLKIKALHMAQVEYYDILRRVNQMVQSQLVEPAPAGSGPQGQPRPGAGPRLVS